MKMVINKKIGKENIQFEFEGNDLWECQMAAQKLSFGNVEKCGLCGDNNLRLSAYKTEQGYKYVTIRCSACKAKVTFGQRQEDNTMYLRKNEDKSLAWERYEG